MQNDIEQGVWSSFVLVETGIIAGQQLAILVMTAVMARFLL